MWYVLCKLGHRDTSLSEKGIRQAQLLSERLRHERFTHVFTSDLQRAKQVRYTHTGVLYIVHRCVIQYWHWQVGHTHTATFTLWVWISLRAICKQPWASCWPTVCSGQLSLLPFMGWKMHSCLWATGWRPSVTDCGDGMSVCCTAGPVVH